MGKLPLDKENLYPEVKSKIGNAKANLSELVKEFSKQGIEVTESLVINVGVENIPQYIKKYNCKWLKGSFFKTNFTLPEEFAYYILLY